MGLIAFTRLRTSWGLRSPTISKRQSGFQIDRLDGVSDILARAPGASVLDIGCNRGMVSYELAQGGASLVHGCDIWEPGLGVAREVFSEIECRSYFVSVDLAEGEAALLRAFGQSYRSQYDIVLFMAIYHKLKRTMPADRLTTLITHIANRAGRYLLLREPDEEAEEIAEIVTRSGLTCVQRSVISKARGVATIWARP